MKQINTPKRWIVLSVLAGLLFLVAIPVLAAGIPGIDWYVFGGGGGSATGGDYSLSGTIGQPLAGLDSDGDLELCSGFWCKVLAPLRILLPIIFNS